ncbi:Uncharacterised protein [Chlamydia trachomatis]|nr:Uncharacterised protein [Chlamydia trachomatis]
MFLPSCCLAMSEDGVLALMADFGSGLHLYTT